MKKNIGFKYLALLVFLLISFSSIAQESKKTGEIAADKVDCVKIDDSTIPVDKATVKDNKDNKNNKREKSIEK